VSSAGRVIPPLVLVGVVFLLYQGTLYYPFQFDDYLGIVGNRAIMNLWDLPGIWWHNPSRFFHYLSLAFNYHLGELDTFGYHLFNIILHGLAAAVYYYFVGLLFDASARMTGSKPEPCLAMACQFTAALIFAVHPLQTQAVTFIWQRSASMATMLYIGSMALYLKSARMEQEGQPEGVWKKWLALAWVAALCSMMTKQFTVTLPVAMVLLDYLLVSGSLARLKSRAARLGPFIPLILIIPVFTMFVGKGEVGDLGMRAANLLTPYRYLITEFNVITHYLGLAVYPVNQNLDYDFPIPSGFGDSALSFIFLCVIGATGVLLRGKSPAASFGILFFFLAISVESSFYPLEDPVFEHRMYLPLTGLLAALASLELKLLSSVRAPISLAAALALAVILAAPLSAATVRRNVVWSDPILLWEDVVAKSPRKARGYNNLAISYFKMGQIEKGTALLLKAREVDPKFAATYLNLGKLYDTQGNLHEAISNYTEALTRDPNMTEIPYRLGSVFLRMKRYETAARYFQAAIKIKPSNLSARMEFGVALGLAGKLDTAVAVFADIIKMDPANGQAHYNLAMAHFQRGEKAKAAQLFAKAKQLGYLEPAPSF